jgi:hypothetical protein
VVQLQQVQLSLLVAVRQSLQRPLTPLHLLHLRIPLHLLHLRILLRPQTEHLLVAEQWHRLRRPLIPLHLLRPQTEHLLVAGQ